MSLERLSFPFSTCDASGIPSKPHPEGEPCINSITLMGGRAISDTVQKYLIFIVHARYHRGAPIFFRGLYHWKLFGEKLLAVSVGRDFGALKGLGYNLRL